jgi:hypothetical protein
LFHIIRNAMKRGAVQTKFTVKTPLVALTANEAGRIARSLVSILMANVTAKAAVDEHIKTYPALGELERKYRWFRPMMEAIATELMDKVAYVRRGERSERNANVLLLLLRRALLLLPLRLPTLACAGTA